MRALLAAILLLLLLLLGCVPLVMGSTAPLCSSYSNVAVGPIVLQPGAVARFGISSLPLDLVAVRWSPMQGVLGEGLVYAGALADDDAHRGEPAARMGTFGLTPWPPGFEVFFADHGPLCMSLRHAGEVPAPLLVQFEMTCFSCHLFE